MAPTPTATDANNAGQGGYANSNVIARIIRRYRLATAVAYSTA
jgi:hypothetical protein